MTSPRIGELRAEVGELRAEVGELRAEVAAMREQMDAALRTMGRFYRAGFDDASGPPRPGGGLAAVTPISRPDRSR